MAQDERYRKLPGRRRGIIRGSSVWLAADHVLLVKSLKFREEYKRYYLRDIQAIAIATAPRFHISMRSLILALVWVFVCAVAAAAERPSGAHLTIYLWIVAVLLTVTWAIVSAAFSCRCRVYTAVSSDELPSVYRSWTARRFVAELEPHIAAVQGTLEGNWAEAVESYTVGPARTLPPETPATPASAMADPPRPWAAYAFIASLIAGGVADFLLMGTPGRMAQWILPLFTLFQAASTVAVLVACRRGQLRPAWRTLAVVALIVVALTYRVTYSFSALTAIGQQSRQSPGLDPVPLVRLLAGLADISTDFAAGLHVLLGIVGIGLLAAGRQSRPDLARFKI
jgi:hypothetical protein